jgi:hypothetical protein
VLEKSQSQESPNKVKQLPEDLMQELDEVL